MKKPLEVDPDTLLEAVRGAFLNSPRGWCTTVDVALAYRRRTSVVVYRELLTQQLHELADAGKIEHQRFGRQHEWRPAQVAS